MKRIQPTHVFCLVGTTKARGQETAKAGGAVDTYATVDYGLTALLAQAASEAGIRPRFVYLSGAGTSRRSIGAYGKWRWKAEEAVRESGLPYTICRASFIVGPDRDDPRPHELLGARVVDGALDAVGRVGLGRVRDRFRSHTNVDLAAGLVRVALDLSAANRTLEPEDLRARA